MNDLGEKTVNEQSQSSLNSPIRSVGFALITVFLVFDLGFVAFLLFRYSAVITATTGSMLFGVSCCLIASYYTAWDKLGTLSIEIGELEYLKNASDGALIDKCVNAAASVTLTCLQLSMLATTLILTRFGYFLGHLTK